MPRLFLVIGLAIAAWVFRKSLSDLIRRMTGQLPNDPPPPGVEDMSKCPACGVYTAKGQACANPDCSAKKPG